jgi:hypothetical protein
MLTSLTPYPFCVVVGGGQELAEDHLGNPDLVLGMLYDIDRFSIVLNVEVMGVAVDGDLANRVLGSAGLEANHMIVGIHNQLVNELVAARIEGDCVLGEVLAVTKEDFLLGVLDAADVGVGKRENVFAVGLALIRLREVLGRHGKEIQLDCLDIALPFFRGVFTELGFIYTTHAAQEAVTRGSRDFLTQTSCGAECSYTCRKHRIFRHSSGGGGIAGCREIQYGYDARYPEPHTVSYLLEQYRVFVVLPCIRMEAIRSSRFL